ncbi:ribosomal protein S18-alanine N-acetyltransferase [Xanthomonadaceae bacterium JHOS43]|nr:ribosomal protein S18-alanine N-acetyltransferase [Xanthomonadaceae bacterium JHOS43]MCX7562719.1 ribosomal protein S18-alanine N-acetyltransferase [Xanthomonadaceae bacterium XH05]
MNALAAGSSPTMRAMRGSDLEDVMQVELSAYEFPWTQGIFHDCLREGHGCWVLECDGRIIGHGVLSVGAGEAHILNVCVAPRYQGRGHGRHLVQRLIDLARWHRVERVFLEVRPSNANAHRLYESLGFNEIGRRPRYYPAKQGHEDAIVMAMELLPPE